MRNLNGIMCFVEAATAGSFTAAAKKLEVTPQAISKSVIRLERDLSVRLFNRSTRRLQLTDEGGAFLARAGEALRALENAVDAVSDSPGKVVGRVRISTAFAFGRRYVLPTIAQLALKHSGLHLEVSLENLNVDLLAGGFDIGIRGGVVRDSSLVARRVARLPVVLVAAPAYLGRRGVPTSLEMLRDHDVVGVRAAPGQAVPWLLRGASRRVVTTWYPPARVLVSDPEALLDVVAAGAGIGQVGLHLAAPLLRAGRARIVLPREHHPGEREIVLHYPHRTLLSARVRLVVDALLAHFRAQPDLHLDPRAIPAEWMAHARR